MHPCANKGDRALHRYDLRADHICSGPARLNGSRSGRLIRRSATSKIYALIWRRQSICRPIPFNASGPAVERGQLSQELP